MSSTAEVIAAQEQRATANGRCFVDYDAIANDVFPSIREVMTYSIAIPSVMIMLFFVYDRYSWISAQVRRGFTYLTGADGVNRAVQSAQSQSATRRGRLSKMFESLRSASKPIGSRVSKAISAVVVPLSVIDIAHIVTNVPSYIASLRQLSVSEGQSKETIDADDIRYIEALFSYDYGTEPESADTVSISFEQLRMLTLLTSHKYVVGKRIEGKACLTIVSLYYEALSSDENLFRVVVAAPRDPVARRRHSLMVSRVFSKLDLLGRPVSFAGELTTLIACAAALKIAKPVFRLGSRYLTANADRYETLLYR